MSHEIRTPLNAIIGMAALLKETELTSEQRVCAETITTGGQVLLGVINDILDFSRIESGRIELDEAPFDLPACLGAVIDLIGPGARQKGLAVAWVCEPEVPRAVVGDVARLRQILLNLLGNAIKFTERGTVAVHASVSARDGQTVYVTIDVSDTGIGMTAEHLARIFAPFVQAERSTARRYGGTGLGLTICQQLVELMRGTLEVTSSPGEGSTFTLLIPFQLVSAADLPSAEPQLSADARPLRVLVAEDHPVNQEVVRRMLGRFGHAVTIVPDGQAALEAIIEQPYDVILMDAQMPVLDGEEATRRIRALGASVHQPRIIALTADALPGNRQRFMDAGMDGYLSKPVQPAELQRVLVSVTDQASPPEVLQAPPEADEPEADSPLIQWATLAELTQSLGPDGAASMATIVQLFDATLPAQVEALAAAVAARDMVRVHREAHRLRGGSIQLGARAMAAICQECETSQNPDDLAVLIERLRVCYDKTYRLLRERYALL